MKRGKYRKSAALALAAFMLLSAVFEMPVRAEAPEMPGVPETSVTGTEPEGCTLTEGCMLEDGHEGACVTEPEGCTLTEGCMLEDGHEGDCVTEMAGSTETAGGAGKTPCEKTEGCTLEAGHEGDCVLKSTEEAMAAPAAEEGTQKVELNGEIWNCLVDEDSITIKSWAESAAGNEANTEVVIPGSHEGKQVYLDVSGNGTWTQNVFKKRAMETLKFQEKDGKKVRFSEGTNPAYAFANLVFGGEPINLLRYLDVTGLDIGNLKNLDKMFDSSISLETIVGLDTWDVSHVESMASLFGTDICLSTFGGLKAWNVENVRDMSSMFYNCDKLTELNFLSGWNTGACEDMRAMFGDCEELKDLSALKDWDVGNVREMTGMFSNDDCISDLTSLAGWQVGNVTNMSRMFADCNSIETLSGLEDWDVSQVTNMRSMFGRSDGMSVGDVGTMMLKDISALKDWDVSRVKDFSSMFRHCEVLVSIAPLKDWGTGAAATMNWMFDDTAVSDTSPIVSWEVSGVTGVEGMFRECPNLRIADLRGWDLPEGVKSKEMFSLSSGSGGVKTPLLVLTDDSELRNRDFTSDQNRYPYTVYLMANGGGYADQSTEKTWKEFVLSSDDAAAVPSRDYYRFLGWSTNPDGQDTTITLPADPDVTELRLYAKWTPEVYTITYELDGGRTDGENPASYTVESGDITLRNPEKEGYRFLGWTGTGLSEATGTVLIPSGSAGNRTYRAVWEKNAATEPEKPDDSGSGQGDSGSSGSGHKEPAVKPGKSVNAPKTGDASPTLLYADLLLLSLGCAAGIGRSFKKRRNRR